MGSIFVNFTRAGTARRSKMAETKRIQSAVYSVKVTGTSPMMMDMMSDDTLINVLHFKEKRTNTEPQEPVEVARGKVYRDSKGRPVIPVANLLACLCVGGRFVKYDSKKLFSTAQSSLVPSCVSIKGDTDNGEMILLSSMEEINEVTGESWHVDKRRACMKDGTAVCAIRPKFITWGFTVLIKVDLSDSCVTETKIQDLFKNAGLKAGLGSFNPLHKGPFGKFEIAEWVCVEQDGKEIKAS